MRRDEEEEVDDESPNSDGAKAISITGHCVRESLVSRPMDILNVI